MKKIIRLFTILILLSSCGNSSDSKKVSIDNFNEIFLDSLIPVPDKNYAVFYTKIEGHSNDSIRVNINSGNSQLPDLSYYFIGEFEKEIRLDYYGGSNMYITFDPYKATEGEIELTYRL